MAKEKNKDIDILQIPVFYISFTKQLELEKRLKSFGFKNINHFQAIDGKKLDLTQLRKDGTIGDRVLYDLLNGRNDHMGIPSMGAIGCYLSHIRIYNLMKEKGIDYSIILEDDVEINNFDIKSMNNSLTKLYSRSPNSIVTFGFSIFPKGIRFSSQLSGRNKDKNIDKNIDRLTNFYGTHMYIVSLDFINSILPFIFPIEVQIDSVFPSLGRHNIIELYGTKKEIATQKSHKSSIQDDVFKNFKFILPRSGWFYISIIFIILVIILIILLILFYYRRAHSSCQKVCPKYRKKLSKNNLLK